VRRRSALSVVVGNVVEVVDAVSSLDGVPFVLGMLFLVGVLILLSTGTWPEDALATELCGLRKQLRGATFEMPSVPGRYSPRYCFRTAHSAYVRLSTLVSVVMLVSRTTFVRGVPVAMQVATAKRIERSLILRV
jgi:hypothetical protein